MARTSYFAPGVYVEEIPSARQPITGVGTNTVGFIGLVGDSIYVPEANPDYDPVLAQHLLRYQQLVGSSPEGGCRAADPRGGAPLARRGGGPAAARCRCRQAGPRQGHHGRAAAGCRGQGAAAGCEPGGYRQGQPGADIDQGSGSRRSRASRTQRRAREQDARSGRTQAATGHGADAGGRCSGSRHAGRPDAPPLGAHPRPRPPPPPCRWRSRTPPMTPRPRTKSC